MSVEKLREYVVNQFRKSYKADPEVYAYSFCVEEGVDGPQHPSVCFGFNTEKQYCENIKKAFSEEEARWNYAFWLHNNVFTIGDSNDPMGYELINQLVSKLGLSWSEKDEESNFDLCMEKGEKILVVTIDLLVRVVKEIHEKIDPKKPVIIHQLEYDDDIIQKNIEANGERRVLEFVQWYRKEMS